MPNSHYQKLIPKSNTPADLYTIRLAKPAFLLLGLSDIVVNALAFGPRGPGFASQSCHYSTG